MNTRNGIKSGRDAAIAHTGYNQVPNNEPSANSDSIHLSGEISLRFLSTPSGQFRISFREQLLFRASRHFRFIQILNSPSQEAALSLVFQPNPEVVATKLSDRLSEFEWGGIGSALTLSPRQGEIVRLIFDGKDQLAIAKELRIRPDTVHAHLSRLYKKLDVHNRCELIVQVLLAYLDVRDCGQETANKSNSSASAQQPSGRTIRLG